jgi:hypothetical protein
MPRNLVELVLEDHRLERELFERVRTAPGHLRPPAFAELVALHVSHEAAESLVLYPVMTRFLPQGEFAAKARTSEHRAQEALLERLQRLDVHDASFGLVLEVLAALALQHTRKEEELLVPLLRAANSSILLRRLGERYEAVRAATQPELDPDGGPLALTATPVSRLSDLVHREANLALTRRAWVSSGDSRVSGAA